MCKCIYLFKLRNIWHLQNKALSILSLRGTGKVKGFCNKNGQGSPVNHLSTEELDQDTIKKILSNPMSDYGYGIRNSYKQPENSIMKNHITISCKKTFDL